MRNIAATLALLLAMTQAHGAPQQGEDHANGAAITITYFAVCPTAKFYDMDNATRGVLDIIKYQYGGVVIAQKNSFLTAPLKKEVKDQTALDNMCLVLVRPELFKEDQQKRHASGDRKRRTV